MSTGMVSSLWNYTTDQWIAHFKMVKLLYVSYILTRLVLKLNRCKKKYMQLLSIVVIKEIKIQIVH
jgi:hypothetical protein